MIGEPYDENEQILMNYYAAQLILGEFNNRKMIRFISNKEREIVFNEDLDDVVEYLDNRADIELVSGDAEDCRDKR